MEFKTDLDYLNYYKNLEEGNSGEVPDASNEIEVEEESAIFSDIELPKIETVAGETYNLPVPTFSSVMKNKDINLRTFCALLLISNHHLSDTINEEHRYLYHEKLQSYKNYILSLLNVTYPTFQKSLKTLCRKDFNLVVPKSVAEGELVYLLYSKDSNEKNYALISNDILEKLVKNHNSLEIKLYFKIKVMNYFKKHKLTQNWLCNEVGYSTNSKNAIAKALNNLQSSGLITIVKKKTVNNDYDGKNFKVNVTTNNYYKALY